MFENYLDELIKIRREIHQNPELGMQEYETSKFIINYLKKIGIKNIENNFAETGIVAVIEGSESGNNIALRADMDALPITEKTGLEYASNNKGVMHACGHDGHIAMLLVAARILHKNRENLQGKVYLFFQPAEENRVGAQKMIAEGALAHKKIDAILALHLWMGFPAGEVRTRPGILMANSDRIKISITGESTHGAMPHQGIDPITTAAATIMSLQTIISREIDAREAAVLSFGEIGGGSAYNIIPEQVDLLGTLRTLKDEVRNKIIKKIKHKCNNITEAYGAEAEIEIEKLYPLTVNDAEVVEVIQDLEEVEVKLIEKPFMGSEDFSYFLKEIPGALVLVGGRNEAKNLNKPHHHNQFNFEEEAMVKGVEVMVKFAYSYLKK